MHLAHTAFSPCLVPRLKCTSHYKVVTIVDAITHKRVQKRKCVPCSQAGHQHLYGMSSSTDTLTKHIAKHSEIDPQPQSTATAKRPRLSSTSQQSIQSSFVKQNNAALRPALAELFASCSWAHHCVEWPQFIAALDAYRGCDLRPPSRASLRQDILDLAQQMRHSVISRLKGYCRSYPLTVAIDGWTNVRHDKVTNVLVLCGGVAFYWCSIVNVAERNTAVWMQEPMKQALNEIKAEGLIFSALVADNEQVNKTLHQLLQSTFPFLLRSPCAAHLIQLCVNHALNLPAIEPILLDMEELLSAFRFKEHRVKLRQVQQAITGSYMSLIKPCDTRWSSHLAAARRLLKLRSSVDAVISQPPQFWVDLAEVVRFLEPFATATNVVQADSSTLYDFYKQFKLILQHVADTPATSRFHAAKTSINNVIIGVWEKHVSWDAIIISAHLSFDSIVDAAFADKVSGARRWFTEWAAQYSMYWTLSAATSLDEARSTATLEWSQYIGHAPGSAFAQLDADIAEVRKAHAKLMQPFDARAVWSLYLDDAPVIAHAAVALLSVAGSEAAVERSFSAQGAVHSERRNRLTDKMVEAEMYIRFNRLALNRVAGERDSRRGEKDVEQAEDEEEEAAASVAELFKRVAVVQQQPQQQEQEVERKDDEAPVAPAVIRSIPAPRPSLDDVQGFVVKYVRDHAITARFRWQPHHEGQLLAAAVANVPPMRDTVTVLKRKVMAYVRGQAEQEAAVEEAAEARASEVAQMQGGADVASG